MYAEHPLPTSVSIPCEGAEGDALAKNVTGHGFVDEVVCGNGRISAMFTARAAAGGAAAGAESRASPSLFEWEIRFVSVRVGNSFFARLATSTLYRFLEESLLSGVW